MATTIEANAAMRSGTAEQQQQPVSIMIPSEETPGETSPSKQTATVKPDALSKIGLVSLALLVFQNTSLTLTMRASRLPGARPTMYLATSAVFLCELLKLFMSVIALIFEKNGIQPAVKAIQTDILSSFSSNAILLVPSGLYTLQNNLQYYAAGNLEPATFQVLYQMKILTTACLMVMLGKELSRLQWSAVFILTVGIMLVQTDNMSRKDGAVSGNNFSGFVAVLVACCTSAAAGVFIEKLVKETDPSVWIRNIQLSVLGLVVGGVACYTKDAEEIAQGGFLKGFDRIVWVVVCLQSCGGILVAVVLKYADNIVKGFATGLSIILSAAASTVLFNNTLTMQYTLGAAVVVVCFL